MPSKLLKNKILKILAIPHHFCCNVNCYTSRDLCTYLLDLSTICINELCGTASNNMHSLNNFNFDLFFDLRLSSFAISTMLHPLAFVFFLFFLVPLAVGSFDVSNIHHDSPHKVYWVQLLTIVQVLHPTNMRLRNTQHSNYHPIKKNETK